MTAGEGQDRSRRPPSLTVEDLTLRFGGLTVLQSVSLEIVSGHVIGIIGPNGAGKTSLLNCIMGFYQPTSGRILLGGQDLDGLPPHRRVAKGLGRTFQEPQLFNELTLLENVVAGTHVTSRTGFLGSLLRPESTRREEAACAVVAERLLARTGLADLGQKTVADLPYGLKKRAELAKALAGDPSILLVDEPIAGLRHKEIENAKEVFRSLAGSGLALVLIEHNVPFVMDICDRVVVLNFGSVIAAGTPREVRNDPAVIDAYLGPS